MSAVHVRAGEGLSVLTMARSVIVILVSLLMVAGCAQLMADSVEALLKQAIELFTARRYDEAISKLLEVVRRDPKSWNAYLYLARSYIAKSSWAEALTNGRKALELAPGSGDVVPVLAEALLGAGADALARRQFSEAIGHFGEYVKLRPSDAQGYRQLGKAYWQSGNVGNALDAFRHVLQLNPNDAEALQFIGGRR
jgi:tetratricopeptide (TPR) repeat protein